MTISVFQNCEDLRREQGRKLQKVLDDPNRFNFSVRKDLIGANDLRNQEFYLQASPAALGTLVYIRMKPGSCSDEMKHRGQKWVPIDVTSLVRPLDSTHGLFGEGATARPCGTVRARFSISTIRGCPMRNARRFRFILDDMGWNGYLGFVGRERAERNHAHRRGALRTRVFHVSVSGSD